MTPGGPQGGYKLILVPEGVIVQDEDDRRAGQARILVAAAGIGAGWPGASVGPFEVAADVGPDRRITMSRVFFEENVEVTDPP